MDFILASKSPRRRELLENIGLPFIAIETNAEDETTVYPSPEDMVLELSLKKAKACLMKAPEESIIIGADTIVVIGGKILGKPKDYNEGFFMLKSLSGKTHTVYTGMTLIYKHKNGEKTYSSISTAEVTIKALNDREIKAYLDTGEYEDKAGSYGIQGKGAVFIDKICGDYFAVVGFSLSSFFDAFKALGFNISDFWK
ncbi:MAG: Maf family protein [Lachnospiraceae bacterium]|nr:Maf family protein [Lachnospiraceae bacterium]